MVLNEKEEQQLVFLKEGKEVKYSIQNDDVATMNKLWNKGLVDQRFDTNTHSDFYYKINETGLMYLNDKEPKYMFVFEIIVSQTFNKNKEFVKQTVTKTSNPYAIDMTTRKNIPISELDDVPVFYYPIQDKNIGEDDV